MNYSERINDMQFLESITGDIFKTPENEFAELLTDWENEMLNEFYIICNICGQSDKTDIQHFVFSNDKNKTVELNICKECRE